MLSGHLTPRERWIATGSLLLGMVSFTTAIMMANVVLPQLMTSLRADLDQAQWILTAPAIAQTVVMPMIGGSGPNHAFIHHLKVPVVTSGAAHSSAQMKPLGRWRPNWMKTVPAATSEA